MQPWVEQKRHLSQSLWQGLNKGGWNEEFATVPTTGNGALTLLVAVKRA